MNYSVFSKSCLGAIGHLALVAVAVSLMLIGCGGGEVAAVDPEYSLGGNIVGLGNQTDLTLVNGNETLVIPANVSSFAFATLLASNTTYNVTVISQPSGLNCEVNKGSGTIGSAAVDDIVVSCINHVDPGYSLGGNIVGLGNQTGLTLVNGNETLVIPANANSFAFATLLASKTNYNVTVISQPSGLNCEVAKGSGTIGSAAVTDIVVSCPVISNVPGVLRPLPLDFSSRKAVNYGPYRTATGVGNQFQLDSNGSAILDANGACIPNSTDLANEEITDTNVLQDMKLLASAGFGLVRIFESTTKVAERTLRIIRANNLDIKVMLGAKVHSYATSAVDLACNIPSADVDNDNELARTITLANQYKNIVSAVSIGNETMVSWAFSPLAPTKMAGYITRVKGQISQPVTSDDNWAFYADLTGINDPILQVVDFVSIHTYPLIDTVHNPNLWDWKQKSVLPSARAQAMVNAAVASATTEYTKVRTLLDSKNHAAMPIVIGETGWKAENTGDVAFRAHPVNQKMYLDKLAVWANEGRTGSGPKAIFYFEAFDEPWKAADDKWGLFNVNRQARYAIQGLQGATWVNEAGTYTDADAVYWFAPSLGTAIVAPIFTLYADAVTPGELVASSGTNPPSWNTWEGTVSGTANVTGSGITDEPYAYELRPTPTTWGWGISLGTDAKFASNLSNFSAGHLQFDIKTNAYPGTIEVGFQLNTPENEMVDAYLQLSSGGSYGYVNDGEWHHVSIPLTNLVDVAQKNLTAGNSVDLSMVISPFVIADRFGHTGKTYGTIGLLPNVYVDKIFVSSN